VTVDGMGVSKRYTSSSGQVSIVDDWWALLDQSNTTDAFSFGPECDRVRW
jgi:hypothetical protein